MKNIEILLSQIPEIKPNQSKENQNKPYLSSVIFHSQRLQQLVEQHLFARRQGTVSDTFAKIATLLGIITKYGFPIRE